MASSLNCCQHFSDDNVSSVCVLFGFVVYYVKEQGVNKTMEGQYKIRSEAGDINSSCVRRHRCGTCF